MLEFLIGLAGTGSIPMVLSFQALIIHSIFVMALKIDDALGTDAFPCPILGSVMTVMEHKLLTKFFEIKLPTF